MKQPIEYVDDRLKYGDDFKNWALNHFNIIQLVYRTHVVDTGTQVYINEFENEQRKFKQYQIRKNSNFDRLTTCKYFGTYLFNADRFEYQMYLITQRINKETLKEEFEFKLFNFISYANDEIVEIGLIIPNDYKFGMNAMNGQGWYREFLDYPVDMEELYINSPFKGIRFGDYGFYWEQAYLKRRILRLCYKQGATNILRDIVKNEVDWRIFTEKRIKKYRSVIARYNYSYEDFQLLIELDRLKFEVNHKAIPLLRYRNDMQNLLNMSTWVIDWVKVQEYLVYQNKKLSYYIDYVSMLKQLKVKRLNDNVLYPNNLRKAHDNLVLRIEEVKLKNRIKKLKKSQTLYQERIETINKFNYVSTAGELMIRIPGSLIEIIQEGTKLEHCVKNDNYVEGHAKGDFNIMFVRLKSDPNEPLYTFTLENDLRITQFHGYRNQDRENAMHEVIKKFLFDEYLPWVKAGCKQQKQKKERAHPSQQMVMQG